MSSPQKHRSGNRRSLDSYQSINSSGNPSHSLSQPSSTRLFPSSSSTALTSSRYTAGSYGEHASNPATRTASSRNPIPVEDYERRHSSRTTAGSAVPSHQAFSAPRGSTSVPSSEKVRIERGRTSQATAEQEPRLNRRGSRSSEFDYTGPTSPSGESVSQSTTRQRRKPKTQVQSACWKCKKDHLSCDVNRPCHRCVASGQQDRCVDVPPKKRGRPKLDQRAEPESSTTAANRKRPKHYSFEIDPEAAALHAQRQGQVEFAGQSSVQPPSSYHFRNAPTPETSLYQPRSHQSYGTASSSSVYSESTGPHSNRASQQSRPSGDIPRSLQYPVNTGQQSLGEIPRPYVETGASLPPSRGQTSTPGTPNPYSLGTLEASLPPTSPGLRTYPTPLYRSHNPGYPQNHGTRPQQRLPPTSYTHPMPEQEPQQTYSSVRSVTTAQQSGFSPHNQLPALQLPVHQSGSHGSPPYRRMSSSQSRASSASLAPLVRAGPTSDRHGHERDGKSSGKGSDDNGNARKPRRGLRISDMID